MKKGILAFLPWIFVAFGYKAVAQDDMIQRDEKNKKESQEIIIRKKGSKDVNINIQITGDKVLINGKPLVEFKDNEITVNKRKIIVRDGDRIMFGGADGEDFGTGSFSFNDDEDNDESARAFLGVVTEKTPDGARIIEVTKESAAGKAGLEKGDIITKAGDKKIDGPQSLYDAITGKKPKDEIKISYTRDGKDKTTKAVLQEKKVTINRTYSFTSPDGSFKTFSMPRSKELDELKELQSMKQFDEMDFNFNSFPGRQKLGLKIQDTEEGNGVKVLEVEDSSAAAIAGLKKDDIVTEIGGAKVNNTDEAREQLQENREKGSYPVKARRNGNEMNFTIKIPKKLKTANL
jgi:serine protease Do